MADTAMDINTTNYVPAIGTYTSPPGYQGQGRQQTEWAKQQAKKRAKNKAVRARRHEAKSACVQEVLQEKRLEDVLDRMGGLELGGGDAGKCAENNANIRPQSGQRATYGESTDERTMAAKAEYNFVEQKEADKCAEHRLDIQASRDFKIKKRNEARGSTQRLTWREYREESKERKEEKKERGYQQSGLEVLTSDTQRQRVMIPSGGRRAWREARRQARLIVSQGAQYVLMVPQQHAHVPTRRQQAQNTSLYMSPAPRLHREPAFRLDHGTLPDTTTRSRISHGSDDQAQVESASGNGREQVGSLMKLDD
ncbi:hypothetical protein PMIN06_006370 [Paraphaeosphaeria minitans]|uniref:Uncharacterized protein n=1 Tax=Paraphaeosphaeria minitans TaxID=565426 RepID=A0A9P6G7W6_9PLEO|nr:hypothetical protein PMIN01_11611 [Paraphaeosphaeria minitans]